MYKYLFEPLKLGKIELKNRIAFTSIGIDSYNSKGTVTDENISFIKARSRDTAMIITTVSMATYKYGKVKFIGCYDDSYIPSLSRFAAAGKSNGAKVILQLSAMGGPNTLADEVFHDIVPYVPTVNIPDYSTEWTGRNKPCELKTDQIEEIVDDFINAAQRAKISGFDGIELFAAEDFLLSSFITPHFNKRTDKYGGSFENMMRFPVDIIRGIKKLCGDDFIIGFKYNAYYEFPEGDGIDLDMGVKIGKRITKERISYLHAYAYAKHDIPFSLFKYSIMASQYQPRNCTIPVSQKLKENIDNVAIMAVGSILKPDEADCIVRDNKADIISVGRAFIADQDWAYKAKRNILIRPCIRCFVCLDEATKGRIIACSVNPDVIKKREKDLIRTNNPKRILVAGGGPAGITFALAASRRGHKVILYEKNNEIGGNLIVNAVEDLKYEYKDLLHYYRIKLKESDVELHTSVKADAKLVKKINPDVLIIAVGAENKIPEIAGIDSPNVLNVTQAILNAGFITGKRIVLIGGQDYACEAAIILNRKNNNVTLISPDKKLMTENEIDYLTMVLERMLIEEGVRYFTAFDILGIADKKIIVKNKVNNNIFKIRYDIAVNATGFLEPVKEIKTLKEACNNSYIIGDCKKPAKLFQAVNESFTLALNI